ncbi:hypothetical protein RB195_009976 [Necator americanus]|uniref:Uncharacterized protein n=1 Tax=Necator americanus TaxID=51031 RepID=A0ABR1CX68_NECAM
MRSVAVWSVQNKPADLSRLFERGSARVISSLHGSHARPPVTTPTAFRIVNCGGLLVTPVTTDKSKRMQDSSVSIIF